MSESEDVEYGVGEHTILAIIVGWLMGVVATTTTVANNKIVVDACRAASAPSNRIVRYRQLSINVMRDHGYLQECWGGLRELCEEGVRRAEPSVRQWHRQCLV